MLASLLVKENIVHVGAALYLAGFLFRDQMMLRGLIVLGDLVYIAYFYFAPEVPLWGGIFWSAVFVAVNLAMIARLVADRTRFRMSAEEHKLHALLDALTPGEFRRLMKVGVWRTAAAPTVLTEEHRCPGQLAYVVDGTIAIEKAGKEFELAPPAFIGEVAFLTERPASATVALAAGSRYVTWDMSALRRLLLRAPSLRIGLAAALNRDMAEKVARA